MTLEYFLNAIDNSNWECMQLYFHAKLCGRFATYFRMSVLSLKNVLETKWSLQKTVNLDSLFNNLLQEILEGVLYL